MPKLIFKKGEDFDCSINNLKNKKGLEKLAEEEFPTLLDFNTKIGEFKAYVSTDLTSLKNFPGPNITELPFVLKALPVFYNQSYPYGQFYIGKVEIVD